MAAFLVALAVGFAPQLAARPCARALPCAPPALRAPVPSAGVAATAVREGKKQQPVGSVSAHLKTCVVMPQRRSHVRTVPSCEQLASNPSPLPSHAASYAKPVWPTSRCAQEGQCSSAC